MSLYLYMDMSEKPPHHSSLAVYIIPRIVQNLKMEVEK